LDVIVKGSAEAAIYKTKPGSLVTRLPTHSLPSILTFVGVLELTYVKAKAVNKRDPVMEYLAEEERDEVAWSLGGHIYKV
jgi:hypothetical protein